MSQFLTPLPFLLDFSFFAPLLLRVVLGFYILSAGFASLNKKEGEKMSFSLPFAIDALLVLSGISLIVGFYLQISAIVVSLIAIVLLADTKKRIPTSLSRAALPLLLVIALSLMITGAGAYAFDLPF
jgi:uncharacterized membrane protein SirB2